MAEHVPTIAAAIERLNAGDLGGYLSLYRPDAEFVGYPPQFAPTLEGVRPFYTALLAAVPDLHVIALDVIEAGDGVAVEYRATGTHKGELFGAPGSGNALDYEGLTIMRFQGDRVIRRVNRADEVTLLTQLGVLPPMG